MNRTKALIVASLAVACFATGGAAQIQESIIEVQDLSAVGTPFAVSGTVSVSEEPTQGRLKFSFQEKDLVFRNISTKTILTFVAHLEIYNSYGRGVLHIKQYECFFAQDVIKPGEAVTITEPGAQTISEPHPADEQRGDPRAEVRVLYVQFLDGSIYGHEAGGREILKLRNVTWRALRRLDRMYTQFGEEEFLKTLEEPVEPEAVDTLIKNIRHTQKKFGTDAAVRKVRIMLGFAEERQQLIGSGPHSL